MIQMIQLGFQGKGCVLINENPEIIYPVIEVINQDLKTGLRQKSDQKKVALELLIPVGARICYGLLGVEFIPNNLEKMSLKVCLSTENESIFEKSIASQLDIVRIGLPSEYSQSVIEGVKLSLDEQLARYLGSGVIRIAQAAHGEVGSSNKFFKQITMILMQLLKLNSINSNKQVTEIIKNFSLV